VFAYELRLASHIPASRAQPRLAAHEDLESFYDYLQTMMSEVGFLNKEHPKKLMPRLRRLFARAALEPEEVNLLRGIVKALSGRPRP
jgi:tRNA/rRNA methyltransferase